MTDESNPYRSKLLEETKQEPSLWIEVVTAKWRNMTRGERAAQIYGGVLGAIPGILLFWAGWLGVKYLWPMIF